MRFLACAAVLTLASGASLAQSSVTLFGVVEGYVHNLSKRTALYTTAARLSNGGNSVMALNGAKTVPGQNSTGFDLGISHKF